MIRPAGGALTFVCVRCELVLDDGVDYAWCPRCSRAVDWLDPALTVWVCRGCDVLVAAAEPAACRCGRQLRRLSQPSTSVAPTRSPVSFSTARRIYLAMLAIWVGAAFVDPRNEPLMRLLLFAAQVASALWIAWTVSQAQAIRDLIRDRKTRILHGLEHATIKLLERRGLVVRSGCTYAGFSSPWRSAASGSRRWCSACRHPR